MDPLVVVLVIALGMPLAVVAALAISARLRGPALRPASRRPIGALVTEAVREERPQRDDEDAAVVGEVRIDSPAAEPDTRLRDARGRGT